MTKPFVRKQISRGGTRAWYNCPTQRVYTLTNTLTDLLTQIDTVQAQINHAMEARESLKAEYREALKAMAKQMVDEAVEEFGYGIVSPIHDIAKDLMAVFPLPPEESVSYEGAEGFEFENIPFYPPAM